MSAVLGFSAIAVFLYVIMAGRMSVLAALVLIPVAFGIMTGAGWGLGPMMLDGLAKVAPVGIMIAFALLYFGLMLDRGLFDPLIRWILRICKGDPVRITVATAVLTTLVALDGDGSTTFLITIAALRPIYDRLGMNRLVMTAVIGLSAGIMNILPWGGPTARVMTVFSADATAVFNPLVPVMGVGLLWTVAVAIFFGIRERKRLGWTPEQNIAVAQEPPKPTTWHFWFNLGLTLALLAGLLAAALPLPVLFVLASAIALVVNFPKLEDQTKQIVAHADSVVAVTSLVFAAGIFTGVLTGTGMIDAMAKAALSVIPAEATGVFTIIVALTSMPLSLALTGDAYYFGVVPVLAQAGSALGLDVLQVGRAALLGHMTTGFPLSPLTAATFILVGRSGVNLGAHQKYMFPWAFGSTVVMAAAAYMMGVI
ncbi:MAG: citrate:proton symporter [Rhodospirillaceae bacterium]|nr:citrate:proton symporter [Rhodospirillaceae bacterium]